MQIEGTKLIFVMNFSVLDFFKFGSKVPQIAQILVSTFNIFRGRGVGVGETWPRTTLEIFFSFISSSRLCYILLLS